MTSFLKFLPLLAVLAAAPVFAAEADEHQAHHPAGATQPAAPAPDAKPDPGKEAGHHCRMMEGGQAGDGQKPKHGGGQGQQGMGGMMGQGGGHCMDRDGPSGEGQHDHGARQSPPKN